MWACLTKWHPIILLATAEASLYSLKIALLIFHILYLVLLVQRKNLLPKWGVANIHCVQKKSGPTTFVNNNFKSSPIVKIFYIQNQQNVIEIILYFCLIITFLFIPLPTCLLTIPRCHRSSAADASQLWVANVCWGTLQAISVYHTSFLVAVFFINILSSFDDGLNYRFRLP